MIDFSEHVYDDDPRRGHPDVRTRLEDAAYFFIGNGLVQGAVQFAPAGDGTPLGLLIMDPERLGKKRDALSFDPTSGLEATAVRLAAPEGQGAARPGRLEVEWATHRGVPAVLARWSWNGHEVRELFYCPDRTTARLVRQVTVGAAGSKREVRLRTGVRHQTIERTLSISPGAEAQTWFVYTLDPLAQAVEIDAASHDPLQPEARDYWSAGTRASFNHGMLDRMFNASRYQLPAVMSAGGRIDASIWQYNREWVRDQAFMALGLLCAGRRSEAATIFERLLREFVTEDGATMDSSEVRSRDEVELDQNGVLLHALHQYVLWTGDLPLVARAWDRVAAVADYPLRPEFLHEPSGMLSNVREFWERHRLHGIEPGLELAHQVFVSIGLSSAASLARLLSRDTEATRWDEASQRLRDAVLTHPRFALADHRGLVKRKGLDGRVQERIVPVAGSGLPLSVPLASRGEHLLNPDTSSVLPIALGFVRPDADLASSTLEQMEQLWNQAWSNGGYGRYHASSEPDSPGGWPFASLFVARASMETGNAARAWRVLRWLDSMPGAAAGSWFEYYGPRVSPPYPQVGVIPWTWAEMLTLLTEHLLGVRLHERHIRVRPRLLPGLERVTASLPIRDRWLRLDLRAAEPDRRPTFHVAGGTATLGASEVCTPYPGSEDVTVEAVLPAPTLRPSEG
jgi:hypothetical protein